MGNYTVRIEYIYYFEDFFNFVIVKWENVMPFQLKYLDVITIEWTNEMEYWTNLDFVIVEGPNAFYLKLGSCEQI